MNGAIKTITIAFYIDHLVLLLVAFVNAYVFHFEVFIEFKARLIVRSFRRWFLVSFFVILKCHLLLLFLWNLVFSTVLLLFWFWVCLLILFSLLLRLFIFLTTVLWLSILFVLEVFVNVSVLARTRFLGVPALPMRFTLD